MPRRATSAGRKSERPGYTPGRLRDVESHLLAIERTGEDGEVELGPGQRLHVSNLGKVYFPEVAVTKGALMRYYARIWPVLAPHVKDRALVLKRYPEGVTGPIFYQQKAGARVPDGVRVEKIRTVDEGPQPRIIGGELITLLYTVQLGAIEVHPWLSRVDDVECPDRCLIDLDPGNDVVFGSVVALARDVMRLGANCGLPMAVKTSGSRGMHLVIPLPPHTSYETSARLAMQLAGAVVAQRPDLATVERSIKNRPAGTIYVDAMQNARGKSMAGAYSVRPRPTATVSTPVRARELTSRLRAEAFSIRTLAARVMRVGDLWADALASRVSARSLRQAMDALDRVLDDAPATPTPRRAQRRSSGGGAGAGAAGGHRRSRRE